MSYNLVRPPVSIFLQIAIVVFALVLLPMAPASYAKESKKMNNGNSATITVGGGCFWCVEAVFQQFRGVTKVVSGYAGGAKLNPTYEDVSEGESGHAEVVQVTFDPQQLPLETAFTIFFHAHDPTTKNRQGADVGTQYRSIILFTDETQKAAAQKVMGEISESKLWGQQPLTTELVPLDKFYSAEEYHQNYFNQNETKPYCSFVIAPKIKKIRSDFKDLLK